MSELIKGMVFFSCFLPSFTRIGYNARKTLWRKERWDFSDQNWIVTGATSGIGLEIAQQAARAGAQVHVISRNAQKLAEVEAKAGTAMVTHTADLSNMNEVQQIAQQLPKVDVLVNNVGLMLNERHLTQQGHEQSFATNVLGHYLLTETLDALKRLEHGTVINMSSGGMYNVPMTLERLQGGDTFDGMLTYAYQKRAQVLLNSWWRAKGLNSYVMHPGWVDTPGVETAMPDFYRLTRGVLRSPSAGADTALWLAAHQPEQLHDTAIWFDRSQRNAHYFSDTRKGASDAELISYLDQCLAGAMPLVA
ncbi:MAG: SDR family NAD(P)-dependent oxidoreductase [Pseudomonadota bacterium]